MRWKLDPREALSCCPQASSGIAAHLPCSHKSESMSAPHTDPVAERIEYSPPSGPPVQGCERTLRFGARRGREVRSPAHRFCTVRVGVAPDDNVRESEAPSRLARSCCPARAFRHLHRNTSARTLPPLSSLAGHRSGGCANRVQPGHQPAHARE
jgi:hypothetical protein